MNEAAAGAIDPADHLRFVWGIARRYAAQSGEDVNDLVQEGSIALVRAARAFDPSRGTAFTTYATWKIFAAITHYLRETRTVHLPDKMQRKARREGTKLPGQMSMDEALPRRRGRVEGVDDTLHDILQDAAPGPEADASEREERNVIWAAVDELPTRDGEMLRLFFLEGLSHKEIGAKYGITRQAVHLAISKALQRLRPLLEYDLT